MATREYEFIVGPETGTLPTAGTPSASSDVITLGYADENYVQGGSAVADITALKAVTAANRSDKDIRMVESTRQIYIFESGSSATGDDDFVVTPSSGTGRWLKYSPASVKDADFSIVDDGDITKVAKFQASGITTATTRTFTLPDASTTLVGTDATQTFTNKTFDAEGTGNSLTNVKNANIKAAAAIDLNKLAAVTASRALVSDGSGFVSASSVTSTELGYVSGVTSSIQNQINALGAAQSSFNELTNLGLSTSVGSSALTIALKQSDGSTDPASGSGAVKIGFRSSTITSGAYNQRSVTGALSLVISSGSTLGHTSGNEHYIYVYAIDNAGTVELAASQTLYPDETRITTLAEGGAGAADSNASIYSTTARSDVPCRCIARLRSTQATAGTWASAITDIQLGTYAQFAKTDLVACYAYDNGGITYNQNAARQQILIDTTAVNTHNMMSSNTITIPITGLYELKISNQWTGANMSSGASYTSFISTTTLGGTIILATDDRCSAAGGLVMNTASNIRTLTAGTVLYFGVTSSANHSVSTVSVDGSAAYSFIVVRKI